jgi:hypothetical protein
MKARVIALGRLLTPLVALVVAGCVKPADPKSYDALRASDPHSILIVPAVNQSVYVNAPDYYLSTITRPLADRGYYVFPVHTVKRVMEEDGLSDADLVQQNDPKRLGQLFGADAILYVKIERWDSQYLVISTTTTVKLDYRLVDARTGQELWKHNLRMEYTPQSASGGIAGLVAQAIVSALEKADPNYMPLARQLNAFAASAPHQGLPAGPHDPSYGKDRETF